MSTVELKYLNHYECDRCGAQWSDAWDCTCNDRCPSCNAEIEPYTSDDLPQPYETVTY